MFDEFRARLLVDTVHREALMKGPYYGWDIEHYDAQHRAAISGSFSADLDNTTYPGVKCISTSPYSEARHTLGVYSDSPSTLGAQYDTLAKWVWINSDSLGSSPQSMTHHLHHELSHHEGWLIPLFGDGSYSRTLQQAEIGAEATACIISDHVGIDSSKYTVAYLAQFVIGANMDALPNWRENVVQCARTVYDNLYR